MNIIEDREFDEVRRKKSQTFDAVLVPLGLPVSPPDKVHPKLAHRERISLQNLSTPLSLQLMPLSLKFYELRHFLLDCHMSPCNIGVSSWLAGLEAVTTFAGILLRYGINFKCSCEIGKSANDGEYN